MKLNSKRSGFDHEKSIKIEPNTRFNRLIVESFAEFRMIGKKKPQKKAYYNCICDCGNKVKVNRNQLVSGNTKSCGCLAKELVSKRTKGKPSANRKLDGTASFSHLFASYRHGAKTRGYEFSLDKEYFKSLTQMNCYYCNKPPSQIHVHHRKRIHVSYYTFNGVDRIDNTKGYIEGNVAPCCGHCNKIKGIMSEMDFIDTIKRIYEYRFKKED